MTDDTYKQAFALAVTQLSEMLDERERLDSEREEVDRRIATLRDGLLGLGTLAGIANPQKTYPDLFPDLLDPDTGITDAVRKVLSSSSKMYLSPVTVRDGLVKMGFDTKKYKNILASIHQILKRLYDSREVVMITREGKAVYRWNMPTYAVTIPAKGA